MCALRRHCPGGLKSPTEARNYASLNVRYSLHICEVVPKPGDWLWPQHLNTFSSLMLLFHWKFTLLDHLWMSLIFNLRCPASSQLQPPESWKIKAIEQKSILINVAVLSDLKCSGPSHLHKKSWNDSSYTTLQRAANWSEGRRISELAGQQWLETCSPWALFKLSHARGRFRVSYYSKKEFLEQDWVGRWTSVKRVCSLSL